MAGIDSTESVQRLSIAGKVLQLAMSAVLAWLCAVHPTFAGSTGQTIPFGSAPIAPPETIDTIIVAGNRTTQNFVILSEIKLTPGSLVDSLSMREDMERLESLGIFSRAELTLLRLLDGSTALMIRVTELWYIWPGIYFAVDEQSPDRVAYGMILANSNFRGRREHLSVNGRIGYTQGGEFMWEIPYLSTARPRWSMKMSLAKITEQEPRYLRDRTGVEVQDFSANLVFSHRFNLENSISLRSRVSNREFRSISEHVVITPEIAGGGASATTGELSLGIGRNTRTYRPWPSRGYILRLNLTSGFALDGRSISFFQPQFMAGLIISPFQPFHIALRGGAATLLGNAPLYRQYVLNRDNGVRTAAKTSFEGTWRSTGSVEFRGDLIPIDYVTIPTFAGLQRYTRNLRLGLSATLFVDGGVVGGAAAPSSTRPDLQQTDGWEVAYGTGLVFHVPYHDVIRLELSRSARFPADGLLLRLRIGASF